MSQIEVVTRYCLGLWMGLEGDAIALEDWRGVGNDFSEACRVGIA
jgi:hypothetical protein